MSSCGVFIAGDFQEQTELATLKRYMHGRWVVFGGWGGVVVEEWVIGSIEIVLIRTLRDVRKTAPNEMLYIQFLCLGLASSHS